MTNDSESVRVIINDLIHGSSRFALHGGWQTSQNSGIVIGSGTSVIRPN